MNNLSKNAFKFNPWTSIQGRFLQYVIKPLITKTVYTVHKAIKNRYDPEAYVFDDPRLKNDRETVRVFLVEWVDIRIQNIVNAVADIFFFLLKEDGRYRRLYIVFRNKMILEGHIYALDSIEQEELTKWKGK